MAADVDLELSPAGAEPSGSRRRGRGVVVVLTVLALVAVTWAMRHDGNGDVEVGIDESTTTSTTPTTSPSDRLPAVPIALGAATDGKDSVGLPITAEPSTGLVDGQTVSVSGSGFPPNESIGVVMCTREAARDQGGRGVDACNIGRYGSGTSDAAGNVTIEFAVSRLVLLDGQEVDCASEAGRCLLGMGMISDYDQSGGATIDFDPSVPLPDPPSVVLDRHDGLTDGMVVPLRVTGLRPGVPVYVSECATDTGECTPLVQGATDDAGAFTHDVRLWRSFGGYLDPMTTADPNVDCAVRACQLRVDTEAPGGRTVPAVDLRFDPGAPARQPPVVELPPGPYRVGDTVPVRVRGVAGGDGPAINICTRSDTGGECWAPPGPVTVADGIVEFTVPIDPSELGRICVGGDCVVLVFLSGLGGIDGARDVPPILFPAPVPFPVET